MEEWSRTPGKRGTVQYLVVLEGAQTQKPVNNRWRACHEK